MKKSEVRQLFVDFLTAAASGSGKTKDPCEVPSLRYPQTCLLQPEFTDSSRMGRRSAVLRSSSGVSSQRDAVRGEQLCVSVFGLCVNIPTLHSICFLNVGLVRVCFAFDYERHDLEIHRI